MLRRIAISLLLACLVVFAILEAVAWKNRSDAKWLLDAMTRMASEADPSVELSALQHEFGKKVKSSCVGGECDYELVLSSWKLSRTGLFPCCEINAYLGSRNDSLEYFLIEFRQLSDISNAPHFHVQETLSREPMFSFFLNPHGKSQELWNGMVDFNPTASEEERRAAVNFNLNCFVRPKGCRDLSEMAPTIWKVDRNEAIYTRIRSKADAVQDIYAK